jgi:predicted ATPase
VEACASLVSHLLHNCPNLRVLTTSRDVLAIGGETIWRVDPLAVPPSAATYPTEAALQSESVTLFVERAAAAVPGFRLTDRNAASVIQICQRLDGLPLALELAAARLRILSVEDLANRLDRRFDLLTFGSRDALPRHRTLRSIVDWSYDLLTHEERLFFQRLSVFSGGWTLDAAEAICGFAVGPTLDMLGRLVDKSLVLCRPEPDGSLRYGMLETLREYAAERLCQSIEGEDIQRGHAMFFADVLQQRWGRVWWDTDTSHKLGSVERDYDNFRASLRWLIGHGEVAAAQRLAGARTVGSGCRMFWRCR